MNWPIGLRPELGLTMTTWESISRMWIWAIENSVWLVVWNMNVIFPYIVNFIIPTDELIFFRGVAQPPTRKTVFCTANRGWSIQRYDQSSTIKQLRT